MTIVTYAGVMITTPDITGLKGSDRVQVPCGRCAGTGIYHAPTSASWENGSGSGARPYCFECNGAGYSTVLVSSIRARERREAKAAEARRIEQEAAEAARAAWTAAGYAELLNGAESALSALRSGDPLAAALSEAYDALNRYTAGPAEAESVERAIGAIEARKHSATPAPEGKTEVEGEIVSIKWKATVFGGAYKALIQCDGYKVWGTCPAALSEAQEGDRVAFTATFTRSVDDAGFAFYSRPSKARIVAVKEES